MKKYNRKYIGMEFMTKGGNIALVIDGGSKHTYFTVRVKDWVKEVLVYNLKNKMLTCPYDVKVFGIGYKGVGKYKISINGKLTKVYETWNSMIRRCYDGKLTHKRRPTYIGCSVEKSWINFQTFGDWFDRNYVEGFVLDKDLLAEGNKLYSDETCVFIPARLNSFMINSNRSDNTSGYTGVSWNKKSSKWIAQIQNVETKKYQSLGYFNTPQEASQSYTKARAIMASRMRNEMVEEYGITNTKILDAIR